MVRILKVVLGTLLLVIGTFYEILVYVQLDDYTDSEITSPSTEKIVVHPGTDYIFPTEMLTYSSEQIPKYNYHHILYGLGLIAGAILLASVKEKD